jgi:hypothetical protein
LCWRRRFKICVGYYIAEIYNIQYPTMQHGSYRYLASPRKIYIRSYADVFCCLCNLCVYFTT